MLLGFMNFVVFIVDCVCLMIFRYVLLMFIRGCDVVFCGELVGVLIIELVCFFIWCVFFVVSFIVFYYGVKWGVFMGCLGDGGIEVFVGIIFVC